MLIATNGVRVAMPELRTELIRSYGRRAETEAANEALIVMTDDSSLLRRRKVLRG